MTTPYGKSNKVKLLASLISVFGIFFYLVSAYSSSPPNLPFLVYGEVAYSDGTALENVKVTATWIDENGNKKSASTFTLTKLESEKMGYPELAGYYRFKEDQIVVSSGTKIDFQSQGGKITVYSAGGVPYEAPVIIVPEKKGIFNGIANSLSNIFGLRESKKTAEEKDEQKQITPDSEEYENETEEEGEEEEQEKEEQPKEAKEQEENKTKEITFEENESLPMEYVNRTGDNYSPIIRGILQNIYVCEGNRLDFRFNITDPDKDNLSLSIYPEDVFSVSPQSFFSKDFALARIVSDYLYENSVGTYSRIISVSDGDQADVRTTNIHVIEINNKPYIENLAVKTIETGHGEKKFNFEIIAGDEENGMLKEGKLKFEYNFLKGEKIFSISNSGIINFSFDDRHLGNYLIEVCVQDSGIKGKIHEKIGLCGQDGKPIKTCSNLSINVVVRDAAPKIVSNFPIESGQKNKGNELTFNVSVYDEDGGDLEVSWFVDNVLREKVLASDSSEFVFKPSCKKVKGINITAEVSDGLLKDSFAWNVEYSSCKKSFFESIGINLKELLDIIILHFPYAIVLVIICVILIFFLRLLRTIRRINTIKQSLTQQQTNQQNQTSIINISRNNFKKK